MFRSFHSVFGFGAKKKPLQKVSKLVQKSGRSFETLEDRVVPAAIDYLGGNYSQSFDALPTSTPTGTLAGLGPFLLDTTPVSGQDLNFGLTGWQIQKPGGSGPNAVFLAGTGGSNGGAAYSLGVAGVHALSERAFGA